MVIFKNLKKIFSCEPEVVFIGPMKQSFPLNQIETLPTIFIDGGSKHIKSNDDIIIIGDGDSCSKKYLNQITNQLPSEKEYSDLSYALSMITSKQRTIYLNGFLDGRLDHEIINFGEAYSTAKKVSKLTIHFSDKISIYPHGINDLIFFRSIFNHYF